MPMARLPGTPRPLPPERVTKLDAARRQLATAITLWFTGGDTVSIYTLSHAAYEVIHNITRPMREQELLFDSRVIRDEYRSDVNSALRAPANFFKHAKREKSENSAVEFHPHISETFMIFTILGLSLVGQNLNDEERAFSFWTELHKPYWLTEEGRRFFSDRFPVEVIDQMRRLKKGQFFEAFMEARRRARER